MPQHENALDLFAAETNLLLAAYEQWDDARLDRYNHDTVAKFILEHLVVREAARVAIIHSLGKSPPSSLEAFYGSDRHEMRAALCRLSQMTEGVSAGELNIGQDFDRELAAVRHLVVRELPPAPDSAKLHAVHAMLNAPSAHYVRTHAPSRLSAEPQRWERVGPVVRLRTYYDHVRRMPTPNRRRLPSQLRELERSISR